MAIVLGVHQGGMPLSASLHQSIHVCAYQHVLSIACQAVPRCAVLLSLDRHEIRKRVAAFALLSAITPALVLFGKAHRCTSRVSCRAAQKLG